MARKDDILKTFLEHKILVEKYELRVDELPNSITEAKQSEVPIIRSIALIVDSLEGPQADTDSALRNLITQYLNSAAI
ncbi:MAG: hypothetical protein ABJP45_04855 [Cyclobacteriaceae bacterium]